MLPFKIILVLLSLVLWLSSLKVLLILTFSYAKFYYVFKSLPGDWDL